MTDRMRAFQRDFAAALLGDDAAPGAAALAAQPGFAVYRNTVMAACIDALAANYPTVRQLVGDAWFHDAARLFVHSCRPRDSRLAGYGQGFAGFLAGFEPARELPYLSGVARLDRCWTEAHLAADAPMLAPSAFASFSPLDLAGGVLVPHPAARWATFESMPVYALWQRHRERLPLEDLPWRGDGALLVRPAATVAWQALSGPGAAFMAACAQGAAFADAVEAALGPRGDRDGDGAGIEAWLPGLIGAGAFTRLDRGPP